MIKEDSLATRLKKFRLSKNAVQKDIACSLGCTISTYSRYEQGSVIIGKNKAKLCNI